MQQGILDRIPPQNLECEQAYLASIMISRDAYEDTSGKVYATDFYREAHQTICNAITSLYERNEPVDILTVQDELQNIGKLQNVGGTEYLMALIDVLPTAANAEWYADQVRECSVRRQVIDIATKMQQSAHNMQYDLTSLLTIGPDECIELATKHINKDYSHIEDPMQEAFEQLSEWDERKELVTGIPTGLHSLDTMTTGWQKPDYIIIGARPSNGKTALMLQMALGAAKAGIPVGLFSLEMKQKALAIRMISHEARISGKLMRVGGVDTDGWEKIGESYNKLSKLPIYICENSSMTVKDMVVMARKWKMKHGVQIVFIDFFQMIKSSSKYENEVRELSANSLAIKTQLTKDLDLCAVVLSQLSREAETSQGHKNAIIPQSKYLKGCGSQEQDADVIILIDNQPDIENSVEPKKAKLIIPKQRNLTTGTIEVIWDGNEQKFIDIETKHSDKDAPPPAGQWARYDE